MGVYKRKTEHPKPKNSRKSHGKQHGKTANPQNVALRYYEIHVIDWVIELAHTTKQSPSLERFSSPKKTMISIKAHSKTLKLYCVVSKFN